MAAQSIYSYELSDPKNPPQIQELLDQLDASAINKLKQNTLDISTEDELVEELEYEKLTLPEEFQKSWKEMVGDYPCEEGTRMAVQYPQIVDGISIVQTHPKSEQLLSLTVKKINKDNQGNII